MEINENDQFVAAHIPLLSEATQRPKLAAALTEMDLNVAAARHVLSNAAIETPLAQAMEKEGETGIRQTAPKPTDAKAARLEELKAVGKATNDRLKAGTAR